MNNSPKKINTRTLERYLLAELPENKMKEISLRLEEDPGLQEAIAQLKHSNKEILNQYPPETMVPQVLNLVNAEQAMNRPAPVTPRLHGKSILWRRLLYVSTAFAGLLIFVVLSFYTRDTIPSKIRQFPGEDDIVIKGSQALDMTKPHLLIYRKNKDNIELLKDGMMAEKGDLLQMAYVAAGKTQGVILSLDGNGMVTLHYPDNANQSPILKQEKKVFLGTAYELDDAPGFERFFFITSTSAIDVGEVINQAKQLTHGINRAKTDYIRLSQKMQQISILIIKKGMASPQR